MLPVDSIASKQVVIPHVCFVWVACYIGSFVYFTIILHDCFRLFYFRLPKHIFRVFPVGFKGNLSLLDIHVVFF